MTINNKSVFGCILMASVIAVYAILQYLYDLFNLPYFWDELGVYSRAAIHLYEHGPGLLPSALPDELSRGHPILIPFIFSVAFKIFGCKVLVARILAAIIYLLAIIYAYRIFLMKFAPLSSSIFAFLIFIQPCFLSQSVLVLPEMPLMVASVMALFYFLKREYIALSICLSIALFIKESAIILPFVFYFTDLLVVKFKFKNLLFILIVPFLLIASFFFIQYVQRGYVFYPLHTSLMKFEMYFIKERYQVFSDFVIHGQGRNILFVYLPLLFSVWYYKSIFRLMKWDNIKTIVNANNRIYIFCAVVLMSGLVFSVLNYILSRYTLYFLVFVYIGLLYLLFNNGKWHVLNYVYIIALLGTALFYNTNKVYTDVDFSYVNHIESCRQTLAYLNTSTVKNKTVAMGFPISVCTWNPHSGYFKRLNFQPKDLKDSTDLSDNYYVFTFPGNIDDTMKYLNKLRLEKQIRNGYAYVNIYTPKSKGN